MSDYFPSGRLSAVQGSDTEIQIQTEYSKYPQPRIATSVSIDGRVLHKIQKVLEKEVDSPEELERVNQLINRQHDEVVDLVKEHGSTLMKQQIDKTEEHLARDLITQVEKLPAVESAFVLGPDGIIHSRQPVTPEVKMLGMMITSMVDLLFGVAEITRLGDHQDSVISLGEQDLLLIPFKGGYLAAMTKSNVKKKEILVELEKIASAA